MIKKRQVLFALSILLAFQTAPVRNYLRAEAKDTLIKERKSYGKVIRTRMPPQIMIETIQKEFNLNAPRWKTTWQTFVVEDDQDKDEFVIIARSYPKLWAFGLTNSDCPKPENYDQLTNDIPQGGTPVRMDMIVGVKRTRSFFRYIVTVYEPMYDYWKNPCFEWNLSPGKANDAFYKDNYNTREYAKNLSKLVYETVDDYGGWKSPSKLMKIPAMRGAGQELMGEEADTLTNEEKKLPIEEQEKLLEKRRKKADKEERKNKR